MTKTQKRRKGRKALGLISNNVANFWPGSYRKFDATSKGLRETIITNAAKILLQSKNENDGRLPRGVMTDRINEYQTSIPALKITRHEINNQMSV